MTVELPKTVTQYTMYVHGVTPASAMVKGTGYCLNCLKSYLIHQLFNHRMLFTTKPFLGYGYLLWSVFPLLLGASTGNLVQVSLSNSLGLTHPLISKLSVVKAFDQQMFLLTENCLQYQKWCPYKGRGMVSTPVYSNKVRNGPASAAQAFLQPCSQDNCHVHGISWLWPPTYFYPTLFAKPIFKMDCAN